MIQIKKSPHADTRSCDVTQVSKEDLMNSSVQHIGDVAKALAFFSGMMTTAAAAHDYDKLTEIKWFYENFQTKFEQRDWWDNHRKIHRHHLSKEDGIPADVNLVDVLEYISDCVMAGLARNGEVYDITLPSEVLQKAMKNTVELLKQNTQVQK